MRNLSQTVCFIWSVGNYDLDSLRKIISTYDKFVFDFATGLNICSTSATIYIELNEKIELTCELLHLTIAKFTYIGVSIPQLLITGANYFVYDLKDESYYLTVPVMWVNYFVTFWPCFIKLIKQIPSNIVWRLPFNWRTPFGYAVALVAQFTGSYAVLFCASTVFGLFGGSIWLFISITQDINNDLKHLKCSKESKKCDQCMKVQFYKIVRFYLDAKQLSYYVHDWGRCSRHRSNQLEFAARKFCPDFFFAKKFGMKTKQVNLFGWMLRFFNRLNAQLRLFFFQFAQIRSYLEIGCSNQNDWGQQKLVKNWKNSASLISSKNGFTYCRLTDRFNGIHGNLLYSSFLWTRLGEMQFKIQLKPMNFSTICFLFHKFQPFLVPFLCSIYNWYACDN